jgi:hypothetical protein
MEGDLEKGYNVACSRESAVRRALGKELWSLLITTSARTIMHSF